MLSLVSRGSPGSSDGSSGEVGVSEADTLRDACCTSGVVAVH
jgi:hypothetical protein